MTTMDIQAILETLPHRYPILLVDRVLEIHEKTIVALKNVSINEPYFVGHFPKVAVMPGVLQLEALAQAAGILSFSMMGENVDRNAIYLFVGIDKARFKRPVVPGDQLRLAVEVTRVSRGIWKFHGVASVDGKTTAEADLMCTLRNISESPAEEKDDERG